MKAGRRGLLALHPSLPTGMGKPRLVACNAAARPLDCSPESTRKESGSMQPPNRRSVSDIALPGIAIDSDASFARARALRRLRLGDMVFHGLTRAAAIGVLLLLGGVIVSLVSGSLPAWRAFGFDFLIGERWNPVTEKFGAL